MNTFTNKVAVITGGNSGIGLATAKELHRRGARVVISGRDEKTLAEAAASIGGDTLAVRADVSRLADLDKLFARTRERFGSIEQLSNVDGPAKSRLHASWNTRNSLHITSQIAGSALLSQGFFRVLVLTRFIFCCGLAHLLAS